MTVKRTAAALSAARRIARWTNPQGCSGPWLVHAPHAARLLWVAQGVYPDPRRPKPRV